MQSSAILSGFGPRVSDAFNASELVGWRAIQRAAAESRRFVATLDDAFQTTVKPLEQYAARVIEQRVQSRTTSRGSSNAGTGQPTSGQQPANDAAAGKEGLSGLRYAARSL